jgi:hypothetical protein
MKFLALVEVAEGAEIARIRAELQSELKASWALFASGVMREAYATETPTRVVFVLEAADRGAASAALDSLPLVAAGMFKVELVELRPFVNWSLMFGA